MRLKLALKLFQTVSVFYFISECATGFSHVIWPAAPWQNTTGGGSCVAVTLVTG